jgi:hypothetical protein
MTIKAIYNINVDIEEFVKVEGLDKNSTDTDIVRVVENYVNAIKATGLYTVIRREKYQLIEEIKKFLRKL